MNVLHETELPCSKSTGTLQLTIATFAGPQSEHASRARPPLADKTDAVSHVPSNEPSSSAATRLVAGLTSVSRLAVANVAPSTLSGPDRNSECTIRAMKRRYTGYRELNSHIPGLLQRSRAYGTVGLCVTTRQAKEPCRPLQGLLSKAWHSAHGLVHALHNAHPKRGLNHGRLRTSLWPASVGRWRLY